MSTPHHFAGDVCAIFVHAGAGEVSQKNERKHLQACEDAARHAMGILKKGGDAVNAVETAIKLLEDNEITNAGYGSNLSIEGLVECDATLVDQYGRSGAVGAVGQICNPIQLARLVLEHSKTQLPLDRVPPNFLVGQGAIEYAFQLQMPVVPNDHLVSPAAEARWKGWKAALKRAEKGGASKEKDGRGNAAYDRHGEEKHDKRFIDGDPSAPKFSARYPKHTDDDMITDTVGAIAIDSFGNIAAGSSSGGIAMKHQGRVGPAALVGIGTAVVPIAPTDPKKTCVATVVSGTGEHIATTISAITCANRIYSSHPEQKGYESADDIRDFIEQNFNDHPSVLHSNTSGAIGILGVKKTVDGIWLTFAHNTDTFSLASMCSDDAKPTSVLSRNKACDGKIIGGGRSIKRPTSAFPTGASVMIQ